MSINLMNTELTILHKAYYTVGADALIFPTNNFLWMGNPISNDIKKLAGTDIEQQAISQGPVSIGTSVVTDGGRLSYKKLIHCACITQDMHIAIDECTTYVENALTMAANHNVQSIHIIPFFLENLHVSLFSIAENMLRGIIDFSLNTKTSISKITIISEEQPIIDAFNSSLGRIFQIKKQKDKKR